MGGLVTAIKGAGEDIKMKLMKQNGKEGGKVDEQGTMPEDNSLQRSNTDEDAAKSATSSEVTKFYKIREVLGEGSFAQVLKAQCREPHTSASTGKRVPDIVAIKRIDKSGLSTDEVVMKEVSILKDVSCEECVSYYEMFEDEESFFLVLECMEGNKTIYIDQKLYLS